MTKHISKAVIACGGLGSRFLPITKTVPKELLPIVDTPVISHVITEAIESGARDILVIINSNKEMIKDYLSRSREYETAMLRAGKIDLFELVSGAVPNANVQFVYQESARGSGDALLYAESFTKNEPFFVAFADDLFDCLTPTFCQLGAVFAQKNTHILGAKTVKPNEISLYGSIMVDEKYGDFVGKNGDFMGKNGDFGGRNGVYLAKKIEEKSNNPPSMLALMGRYIFTPRIYGALAKTAYIDGELRLTDAINYLCQSEAVYACELEGKRYDCGDKFGAIVANIEFGLKRDFSDKLKKYLAELVKTF